MRHEEKFLANFFQRLTADIPIKICFSCRHYPNIRLTNFLEICVEDENTKDITKYIETTFEEKPWNVAKGHNIRIIKEISEDILSKTSGVFLWVYFILQIIDNLIHKLTPWKIIQKKIREVPRGLTDLYTHILLNVDEEDRAQTSSLLRWVRFAERPLSPNELRIAMAFDTDMPPNSLKSWRASDEYHGDNSQWKERITSLSGGLAEVVKQDIEDLWSDETDKFIVQFIHESVNDDFQKEGIQMLSIKQAGSVVGQCHNQLARSCIYYIKCREHHDDSRWAMKVEDEGGDEDEDRDENEDEDGDEDYNTKFIDYAIRTWLWHSEQAENEHCSQAQILFWFGFPSSRFLQGWLYLYEPIVSSLPLNMGSTFLHIASCANLLSLAYVLLTRNKFNVNVKDDNGATALMVASKQRNERMVQFLLGKNADVNAQSECYGNALQAALYGGSREVIELLLKWGADVNVQSERYSNAMQAALYGGSQEVLKWRSDFNAQGEEYGNALQVASRGGSRQVVELLLKWGADVNAKGGFYGNALQAASFKGSREIVELLLELGADVNAQGGRYNNALQAASFNGSRENVEQGYATVMDWIQGGRHDNTLKAAEAGFRTEREAVIRILLKAGAKRTEELSLSGRLLPEPVRNLTN